MAEDKNKEINVLFPYKEIEIYEGTKIKVTPVSLEDMPKVLDAFDRLIQEIEKGVSHGELAIKAMRDVLELLPFCIDCSPSEIPAIANMPDILQAVVDLNFNETTLGKWKALSAKVGELIKGISPLAGQGVSAK